MEIDRRSALTGTLLGTAVGDSLGLPYEGLSKRRGVRSVGEPDRYRFFAGRGMVSDDTEHACLVADALAASTGQVERFRRELAWGLRWWLVGLPAGIGLATLRATLRLWWGVSPDRSGVFSAGNGPAMRAALLGAAIDDRQQLADLVRASTLLTHTDPKAYFGALAVAYAARLSRAQQPDGAALIALLREASTEPDCVDCCDLLEQAVQSVQRGDTTEQFAEQFGCRGGVSGYIFNTVPVAIHAWLSHPRDLLAAITAGIRCGGDTDTVAAIIGGIVGAGIGPDGIPRRWLDDLCEWPRSVAWMQRLAAATDKAITTGRPVRPPRVWLIAVWPRNLLFAVIVLWHGVRRCLPPY
jgi:ADP-ribosyl-[dinitrogen reductase] hydrolase